MERKIVRFEYEFDFWSPGHHDPDDGNANVWVYFDDGTRWCATFYTYRNIETLRIKFQNDGECLNGKYFCADHMILIDRLTKENVEVVINHLVDENRFEFYFELLQLTEEDDDCMDD